MTEGTPNESPPPFGDVARVYIAVLLVVVLCAVVAVFVGLVAELLYAIVAFLFFFVPQKLLERRGEDPADYGMVAGNVPRGIAWGLGATLLTLPFFIPGYWLWETQFLQRDFDFDVQRYHQWSIELDGEPQDWGRNKAGVWIWAERDVLHVGLRNDGGPNNRVLLTADQPFVPTRRGTVHLKGVEAPDKMDPQTEWIATLTHSRSRGEVMIRGPDDVRVTVEAITEGKEVWPMYTGPTAENLEDREFSDRRGLAWLALWIATQFVLVAFPEEYFYRGFIQTRLEQGFAERSERVGRPMRVFLGLTPAIFVTSLLFGIGHLVVPVGGAILANRMAVFFPSLLFGWLRRRTGSILASTIYHAFSNLLVLAAAVHFV